MPTILTHAVAGAAIGNWFSRPLPRGFWLWTVLCAILPDADVVAFDLGIEYGHLLGHRGITHSIAFALLVGGVMAGLLGRSATPRMRAGLFVHFTLVTASHVFLDAFTDDGLGVAVLAPFSAGRVFFPWTPLEVAPIGGHGFFTAQHVQGGLRWVEVLWSELRWVWLPAAGLALGARWWRSRALRTGRA